VAHLGDDVAAFVDGQLSPVATSAAESHLEECEDCRQAVRQQRLLKSRMRGAGDPEPPARLVASLSTLSQNPAALSERPWWSRWLGSTWVGVGFVLLGASMAVVAVAYMVGPPDASADEVAPRFAAEYTKAGQEQPSGSLTVSAMNELDEYGWPCHKQLGDGLQRIAGQFQNRRETVALVYSDGINALNLFEQNGSLDPRAVQAFDHRTVADRRVWVRDGRPRIVTWHADGVVYTIVTELDDSQLGAALVDLPRPAGQPDPVERVGDGLSRMTSWVSAS
jgi:hypothetical protein